MKMWLPSGMSRGSTATLRRYESGRDGPGANEIPGGGLTYLTPAPPDQPPRDSGKVTVTLRTGADTGGRLPTRASLRLMPALAGARYLAGSASSARWRAAAAGPRQVMASRALALCAPRRAAVKRSELAPGCSLVGM